MATGSFHPVNSVIFVEGLAKPLDVALIAADGPIAATPTCITVRCAPEQDGPTLVYLGPAAELAGAGSPEFDGRLMTPRRIVAVSTVEEERLLEMAVEGVETRIRIWLSDRTRPDRVAIGIG